MDSLLMQSNAEMIQTGDDRGGDFKDSARLKENFVLVEYISKGFNAQVYKVQEKSTSLFYAMKLLKKKGELATLEMQREKLIMANLKSYPFLTEFHSLYDTQYRIALVMEYLDGFPMTDYLKILDHGRVEEKNAAFYLAEISLAVHFLHNNGIIHRDIKLANIMINGDGHIKLIDFGISKNNLQYGDRTSTCVGLTDNGAPEYFKQLPYTFSLDWYAVGLALYVMLIGVHPFKTFLQVNFNSKTEVKDIISEPDPEKRLGNKDRHRRMEISEHPFLKDINWIKIEKKEIEPPYVPREKLRDS